MKLLYHIDLRKLSLQMTALSILAVCGSLGVSAFGQATAEAPRIIGYTTGCAPARGDVRGVDVLIFSAAQIHGGRVILTSSARHKVRSLVSLKARDPGLKVVISVGGGSRSFSRAASTPASRRRFAETAVKLVRANHADGLDIDWEFPDFKPGSKSWSRSKAADRNDLTLLLKAIRSALDKAGRKSGRVGSSRYTLSIAVAEGRLLKGVDVAAVSPYVSWFNLMTYSFCNGSTPDTCHQTGLYASARASYYSNTMARAVRQLRRAGAHGSKIMVGFGFYGLEFGGVKPSHFGLYEPYGKFMGVIPWPNLEKDFINKNGFVKHWDTKADAAWLWNSKKHIFITYGGPRSIAAKSAFIKSHHLGGAMYWQQCLAPDDELLDHLSRALHVPHPHELQ